MQQISILQMVKSCITIVKIFYLNIVGVVKPDSRSIYALKSFFANFTERPSKTAMSELQPTGQTWRRLFLFTWWPELKVPPVSAGKVATTAPQCSCSQPLPGSFAPAGCACDILGRRDWPWWHLGAVVTAFPTHPGGTKSTSHTREHFRCWSSLRRPLI